MQGRLDAVSGRPSNFQLAILHPLEDTVKRLSTAPAPGQLVALVGKDSGGSFKTTAAKEYPTTVCRAIAESACISFCKAAGGNSVDAGLLAQL